MAPDPSDRRRGDPQISRITEAFGEVARDVRALDATVKEHTEERRKNRTWLQILTLVFSIFALLEGINLVETSRTRDKVEEVVCDDAQDTRNILSPILEQTLPDVMIPPMPDECQ